MVNDPLPRAGRLRRALRIAAWNLLIAVAVLAIIGGGAELALRLSWPFTKGVRPSEFVPGVGFLIPPGAEARHTNLRDYWTVQRANSLGFLDREPIDPRRAAESCHAAMIGDSFVEALEVPIARKFHVRLEELAARALPDLDVTTSAWGVRQTGTIAQLPLYDVYARRMRPKILVLVFFANNFRDDTPLYVAYQTSRDPDRFPFTTAVQSENGAITLRPPNAYDAAKPNILATPSPRPPDPWLTRTVGKARRDSYLATWVWRQRILPRAHLPADYWDRPREQWLEILRSRPDYAWMLQPRGSAEPGERLRNSHRRSPVSPRSPRMRKYMRNFTAFGVDQFKARADRDEAALLILFVPRFGPGRPWERETLEAIARERGVPTIDLHDYIARQGGDVRESRFAHDFHWNAAGHRWAAEALLEWIARNRHVCGAGGGPGIDEPPTRG